MRHFLDFHSIGCVIKVQMRLKDEGFFIFSDSSTKCMQTLFAFDRKVALHNGMRSLLITNIYVYEPDVSQDFSDL